MPNLFTRGFKGGHLLILLLAACFFSLLSTSVLPLWAVSSATLRVPQDYQTIQAAVNAAQNGDVVLVSPGTYTENITISGKTITLASDFYTTNDPSYIDQTILDGGGTTVITISSAGTETKIVGFTIRNGIDGIKTSSKIQILNNRVTGNRDGLDATSAGGVIKGNIFENNSDDGIDFDNASEGTIEDNIIRSNGNDGIEIRLHEYSGPTLNIVIRGNTLTGNREDGVQLIDYPDLSSRVFRIERNLFEGNLMVGVGLMDNGVTDEDFRAASIPERIYLFNNTFSNNPYAVTGGDNLIALNNIFVNASTLGLKNVDAGSIAAYNLFWNNSTHFQGSNIDMSTTLFSDPLLDANSQLLPGSPAIDAGTVHFEWNGEVVLDYPPGTYAGSASDLGKHESGLSGPTPTSVPSPTPVPPTPTPSGLTTITSQVNSSSDDAEERTSDGNVSRTSTDLELGSDAGVSQIVGMRFNIVQVPRGAVITSAHVEFEVDALDSIATSVTLFGQAADNPLTFSSTAGDISSRTRTTAQVAWNNIPPWDVVDAKKQTPDISPIIQELVNRPGWASGNSVAIIIQGTGERTAESFDGEAPAAPKLVIAYTTEPPTPTATSTPTPTPTDTLTPSNTPTETPTGTPTDTPTDTLTPSNTPTETPTGTPIDTSTPTPTDTSTPTPTDTLTPSNTPTETSTGTPTDTPTPVPTNTSTPTPTSTPQTLSLNPIADTYVRGDRPTSNFGARTTLSVDGSPIIITYMKFDLSALAGRNIISAKLRFKITNSSKSTQVVKAVDDAAWVETTMTYNNRPPLSSAVTSFTSSTTGAWKEVDITSYAILKAGQITSLGMDSAGSDGLAFYSKEASADRPVLVVESN